MASITDIMIITGIKLKYISEKINEYGANHMFQVLDETPLQELTELGKDMKNAYLEYYGIYYLKIHDVKLKEVNVEHGFKQDHPCIIDISFSKYDFQKNGVQITGYSICEINKIYQFIICIYIYIYRMGLSESALKPFSFFITL